MPKKPGNVEAAQAMIIPIGDPDTSIAYFAIYGDTSCVVQDWEILLGNAQIKSAKLD